MSERQFMTDDFAKYIVDRGHCGDAYRPSNGSEGEMFDDAWCKDCKRDQAYRQNPDGTDGCSIYANALAFDIGEAGFPREWVYGTDGHPCCTAHEPCDPSGHEARK